MNKSWKQKLSNFALGILILLNVLLYIYLFAFDTFTISGRSMEPTLYHEDHIIAHKTDNVDRGQIILIQDPGLADIANGTPEEPPKLIKRVIGIPGDKITLQQNRLYVNDELLIEDLPGEMAQDGEEVVQLADNEYFVLGDNYATSLDSRTFGPIKRETIIGRAIFRLPKWIP